MYKYIINIAVVFLLIADNAYANEPCQIVADADQQFVDDLCRENTIMNDPGNVLIEFCTENFVINSKKKYENKYPYSYQLPSKAKFDQTVRQGLTFHHTYEDIEYHPIAFSMTCTNEGLAFEYLVIQYQIITVIPESIGGLTYLKALALFDNEIENIPASLENLKLLEILDLSHNFVSQVPEFLFNKTKMPSLRKLKFSINRIEKIDPTLLDLAINREMEIDLSANMISSEDKTLLEEKYSKENFRF